MKKSFAAIYVLMFVMLIVLLIILITSLTVGTFNRQNIAKSSIMAHNAAKSAIEDGMYQIINNPTTLTNRCISMATASTLLNCNYASVNNLTLSGFYQVSFPSGTIKGVGYYPLRNNFIKVTLVAIPSNNGYIIQQVGN